MSKGILFASVIAGALLVVSPISAQQKDARAAIEAGNKKFAEAVGRGDAAALAALYTKDAMVFPPNADITRGQEAIKGLWQSVIGSGIRGITLTTLEVESFGGTANEVGKYSLKGEGDKELDSGKYIVVWKRENGQWKLHRDIFNTSNPASTR
jgi:ketosteroid isomerase-like protein